MPTDPTATDPTATDPTATAIPLYPAPELEPEVERRPVERRFPEGFTLAVAAVMGAVIVLAGLLLWQLRRSDGNLATDVTTPTSGAVPSTAGPSTAVPSTAPGSGGGAPATTAPPSTPSTASPTLPGGQQPVACPPGTDPVICEAAAYVQLVRQRPFQSFPPVELLADAEFDQALLTDFEQYRADLDAGGVTLTALGLLDPGVSLADAYRDALEIGVVGFYDPETGRLVVRGGGLNLYAQQVLVHELTHALDDQWFDLDRDFPDGEAEYGFSAVVEGNARRVDDRWRSELDPDRQAQLTEDEMTAVDPDDLFRYFTLPPILQQLQLSPYTDGYDYIRHRLGVGGEAAVDADLTEPPTTSEAILHPGTAANEPPEIVVAPPPAGGEAAEEGRLGEMLVTQWLGATAAEGWGGDRYVSWRDGDRSCIAVDLAADSAGDRAELDQAARSWAGADTANRTATATAVDGVDLVRITGCAG